MCKFIGKSNERILCKLSKSEILRLYSIVHVAMKTTKTSYFTCKSKYFISIFFTCQVSACELQHFSCHDLPNDIYSQTPKTVFSHLKQCHVGCQISLVPTHQLMLPTTLLSLLAPATDILTYKATKAQSHRATTIHTLKPLTDEHFFQNSSKMRDRFSG